jgi:nucleoid DNA-binding protein
MTPEIPTIGTTALRDRLAQASETPRTHVHLLLECLALIVADELGQGHRIRVPGIGILEARATKARQGTGPDGQPYSVPARRRVRLRPDRALTRAVEVVLESRRSGFSPTEAHPSSLSPTEPHP